MSPLHPAAETALSAHSTLVRAYPMLTPEQLHGCVVIEMIPSEISEIMRNPEYYPHHDELARALRVNDLPTLAGFTVYRVHSIPGYPEDQWRVRNLLGTL